MDIHKNSLHASGSADPGEALPPFPPIVALNEQPPLESDRVVLSTSTDRLSIWADSDHTGREGPMPDTLGTEFRWGGYIKNYWDGGPPAAYTLTLRRYWRQVDGSYQQFPHGNSMTVEVSHSWGLSVTDSETISEALEVNVGDIGGKVSKSFTHSVTTTQQTSEKKTISVASPAEGMIKVWVQWQLIEEIVALDAGGNIIDHGDKGDQNRKAEVVWDILSGGGGAWTHYPTACLTFPTETFAERDHEFPA